MALLNSATDILSVFGLALHIEELWILWTTSKIPWIREAQLNAKWQTVLLSLSYCILFKCQASFLAESVAMRSMPIYLQKLCHGGVDDHQRTVNQVNNSVPDWDVCLDYLGQHHASWMLFITNNCIWFDIHWNEMNVNICKENNKILGTYFCHPSA